MLLLGLDTSRWEDNPDTAQTIDWQAAKAAGAGFVIMRASLGAGYTDPVFALHKANLAGVLPRGSYHYWRPGQDAKAQAALYFKVAGDLELPPCLDVENFYGDLPTGMQLQIQIIAQLNEIDKLFQQPCMIYTAPNIIKTMGAIASSSPLLQRKLWIANYKVPQPLISPWKKWTFWQYDPNGDSAKYGINEAAGVDMNYYNGTQDDFNREFGLSTLPVPDEPVVNIVSIKQNNELILTLLSVTYTIDGVEYLQEVDQRPVVPPVVPPLANRYRILDDIEAGRTIRDGLPSTVRFHSEITATGKSGKGFVNLSPALMQYVVKINNTPAALKYQFADFDAPAPHIFKDSVGWHNSGASNRVEELTFSGNTVEVYRISGNRAYVKCLYNNQDYPEIADFPTVQMFTIQYSNRLDISCNGKNARTLIVANPGEELWLDLKDLAKVEL